MHSPAEFRLANVGSTADERHAYFDARQRLYKGFSVNSLTCAHRGCSASFKLPFDARY